MNKSFVFAAIALFCQFTAAEGHPASVVRVGNATYKFTDRRFAKDFERTLIFGHSISGTLFNTLSGGGGAGPGTVLAKSYAEVEPLANISEEYGNMETGLSKMHRWNNGLQHSEATPGSDRDIRLMMSRLDQASLIVGVDALYMSVVFNQCSYYGDEVEATIEEFVEKVASQGKVLILGNVPKEDWSQMALLTRMILENGNESCRDKINTALKNSCKVERNCYLVDLERIVNTLNTTGQLRLNDGSIIRDDYGLRNFWSAKREVRWDGVNLTARGVQYIVEDILRMMSENPPRDLRDGAPGAGIRKN